MTDPGSIPESLEDPLEKILLSILAAPRTQEYPMDKRSLASLSLMKEDICNQPEVGHTPQILLPSKRLESGSTMTMEKLPSKLGREASDLSSFPTLLTY